MYCISGTYPAREGTRFDFDYYATRHIPMVVRYSGANVVRSEVRKGLPSADGKPAAFVCVANVWVHSAEEFMAMMAKHGAEIMGDVPNYTDIQPILQVEEVIG